MYTLGPAKNPAACASRKVRTVGVRKPGKPGVVRLVITQDDGKEQWLDLTWLQAEAVAELLAEATR